MDLPDAECVQAQRVDKDLFEDVPRSLAIRGLVGSAGSLDP